jgi:DtxR family Mn-dependent transcriptional regulator
MVSPKMEDYLRAMYRLQRDGHDRVPPSEIAAMLDVTAPTVTAAMKQLHERGLVEREEYRGGRLTDKGEAVALETIRCHRLLELFLVEHLGYDWTEVHEEADRLEHHISKKLEAKLAAVLDDPTADPHGAPIPSPDLDLTEDDAPLTEYSEGDVVRVAQVLDHDSELLDYLAEAGVTPGVQLEIRDVAPFDMMTVVPVNSEPVSLPKEAATFVRVCDTKSFHLDNESVIAG